jgi:hypothetical protein
VEFKDELERDTILTEKIVSYLLQPSTFAYNSFRNDFIQEHGYELFRKLQTEAFKKVVK